MIIDTMEIKNSLVAGNWQLSSIKLSDLLEDFLIKEIDPSLTTNNLCNHESLETVLADVDMKKRYFMDDRIDILSRMFEIILKQCKENIVGKNLYSISIEPYEKILNRTKDVRVGFIIIGRVSR